MGTVRFFEDRFLQANQWIRKTLVTYGEYKNIYRKKRLYRSVTLTKEQKREIRAFFKENYGKRISTKWHRLYQSYTGTYCYNYFPEILFSSQLEPLTNPYRQAEFLADKNLLEAFFSDVEGLHIPQTFLSCVRGNFRNAKKEFLQKKDAISAVECIGKCVVKKTVDTSSGRDVLLCDFESGIDQRSGKTAAEIISAFGTDFVVQEWVEQHAVLAAFNATSLNTFRIITYLCDGAVKCCPVALRLGRNNAEKDNIHYGGISVGVSFDGQLKEQAYSEYGEAFDAHPDSHIAFREVKIEQIEMLLETAKKLHGRMPYFGILSWDLSIDKDEKPVLIEVNTTGQSAWFCQMLNGAPLFGEDTGKMLQRIGHKRSRV